MVGFTWGPAPSGEQAINVKAAWAEFVAMTIFVIVGCGTACAHGAGDGPTRLVVAFTFGIAIMVLAYSIGHHSGGQINCAVTFSLVLGGKLPWYQGLANLIAQLIGSVTGAMMLMGVFPCGEDLTTTLGTNIIAGPYTSMNALLGEVFGTFLLCYVVYETAVSPLASAGHNACVAIGFAVFLAHLILLPIDGCSINPSRSFGPAIISKIRSCENYTEGGLGDLWVMWVGPLIGAAFAAMVQQGFLLSRGEAPPSPAELEPREAYKESDFSQVVPGHVLDEPIDHSSINLDMYMEDIKAERRHYGEEQEEAATPPQEKRKWMPSCPLL